MELNIVKAMLKMEFEEAVKDILLAIRSIRVDESIGMTKTRRDRAVRQYLRGELTYLSETCHDDRIRHTMKACLEMTDRNQIGSVIRTLEKAIN